MTKIMLLVAMLFANGTVATAQEASGSSAPKTYTDVMRTCGMEWRSSDTRKATPKGEGSAAWNTFRRECVKNSGWVSKRNRTATTN